MQVIFGEPDHYGLGLLNSRDISRPIFRVDGQPIDEKTPFLVGKLFTEDGPKVLRRVG